MTDHPKSISAALKQSMFEAVMNNDLTTVKTLVAQGAKVNMTRGTKSLLARALELPTSDMARFLMETGASFNAAAHNTSVLGLVLDRKFHDLLPLLAQSGCSFTDRVSAWSNDNAAGRMAKNQDSEGILALQKLGVPLVWAERNQELDTPNSVERTVTSQDFKESFALQKLVPNPVRKLPTVVSMWVGSARPRNGLSPQWLDTYRALLETEPDGSSPELFAADLGSSYLPRWSDEDGETLVECFCQSRWGRPTARGILAAWMISRRRVQPALDIIKAIPVNTWDSLDPHTSFYGNPLKELLKLLNPETSKPAQIKQYLKNFDQLLETKHPFLHTAIDALPPWAAAITKEGIPWSVAAKLLTDYPENEVIKADEEELRIHSNLTFWIGKPVVHYLSQYGRPSMLKELFTARPNLLRVTDKDGLTPLLRSVSPVSFFTGMKNNLGELVPVLEAFQSAGANLNECSPDGDNLVHLLARAGKNQTVPSDAPQTFLFFLNQHPDLLTQTNNKGIIALDQLAELPFWGNLEVVQHLLKQKRLDSLLENSSITTETRKPRL